jgi:hypothetical protein
MQSESNSNESGVQVSETDELVEVGAFGRPKDLPELMVNQVITAVSLSIAPIADQADAALAELFKLGGGQLEEGFGVRRWLEALTHRELLNMRACALWPFPAGTKVQVDNDGRVFESVTTSDARALPDRSVMVGVEGIVGDLLLEQLTPLVPAASS